MWDKRRRTKQENTRRDNALSPPVCGGGKGVKLFRRVTRRKKRVKTERRARTDLLPAAGGIDGNRRRRDENRRRCLRRVRTKWRMASPLDELRNRLERPWRERDNDRAVQMALAAPYILSGRLFRFAAGVGKLGCG